MRSSIHVVSEGNKELTGRKLAEDGKGEAEEGATVDGMEVMR